MAEDLHKQHLKDGKIGNSGRTVTYELQEAKKIIPNAVAEDFFSLQNGNKAFRLLIKTKGSIIVDFDILIEFLWDYPSSSPNVFVLSPDVTGCPHTLINKRMCYNNPALDWRVTFTVYNIILMIQSWIYAYCKWRTTGIWDWYQHEDQISQPLSYEYALREGNTPLTSNTIDSDNDIDENHPTQKPIYFRSPLYNYDYADQDQEMDRQEVIGHGRSLTNNIYNLGLESPNEYSSLSNFPSNSHVQDYGRLQVNDDIGNIGSTFTTGRIVFTIIMSLMYLALNQWTILVVIPYFVILFSIHKSRTYVFIFLSFLLMASHPSAFLLIPLFGLLYTQRLIVLLPIIIVTFMLWLSIALYGTGISNIQIFR